MSEPTGVPARPIQVVIVDDQEMFAHALQALLELEPDIEVVASVNAPRDIAEIAADADIVLMDRILPTADGIDLTRRLRIARPHQQVVVISGSDSAVESEALDAGAAAFLRKGGLSHEVAETIRRVAESRRDAQ